MSVRCSESTESESITWNGISDRADSRECKKEKPKIPGQMR